MLEFGCSTGFVSRYLKEKGCKVTGIEIDPDSAKKAKKYCEQVLVKDIDKLDLKDELTKRYDVITFGDVLEHLKSPEKVLDYVRDLLDEDGRVLASIPNVSFGYYRMELLKGNFSYEDLGILDKTHLKFFDENNIYAMFESAGYYVSRVHRIKVAVNRTYVSTVLREIGLDDSDEAVKNLTNQLDFDVFQYFVTARPASEKNAMKQLREKETDYVVKIKQAKESVYTLEGELRARDKMIHTLKLKVLEFKHLQEIDRDIAGIKLEFEHFRKEAAEQIDEFDRNVVYRDKIIKELEAKILNMETQLRKSSELAAKRDKQLAEMKSFIHKLNKHLIGREEQLQTIYEKIQEF